MNKTKLLLSIVAIAFGVFMIVFGEQDDSPGAQFLGLLAVVLGIWRIIKGRKNHTE